MRERMPRGAAQPESHAEAPARPAFTSRRGVSLTVLIVNQLIAGVGVASGIAVAAILVADLSAAPALGGLAQSSSVLGAAVVAIPLARLAVRSGRHVALAIGYALACAGAVLVMWLVSESNRNAYPCFAEESPCFSASSWWVAWVIASVTISPRAIPTLICSWMSGEAAWCA